MEKRYRLMKREHFNRVYRRGQSTANRQFVLYYVPCMDEPNFRLGVSISKKLGNAVIRNRLKRRIKEIVRVNKQKLPCGYTYIIIGRKPALDLDFLQMEKSIFHLFRKMNQPKK